MAGSTAGRPSDAAEPSTAELVKQATEQMSRLVRDELRLAQLEMKEKGRHIGLGAGMFGAGGIVALFATGTLIAAIVLALALVLPAWAAALIVAVVLFAVAGVLALLGRRQVSDAAPLKPEETTHSVQADVSAIKGRVHR
ncbi:phage holin family protein [Marinactinospora thermotolerans]|uniref:Putative Holin-X, holin superfamily III n=1 Tax=Marinactinospora thermotolerans DSM 45154 TaxID=1122192 RepID=A0A1T4T2W4_9ACTN|nr:phage holin family protein [Marinactinospora thermotolerans]SKA34737.1 Putative Holin-X, holin superfamily III [Marinactinospora thermotolerans DSM 45154]